MNRLPLWPAVCVALFASALTGQVPTTAFVNFEASQTNPIRLSPDGLRLFAVDTPDARLSVFDVSNSPSPVLIAEIPVGIEPVSVNARTDDEAWVVNQVSDSVSIVSVSKGIVTDTLYAKDEPSDVVFANGRAFVSISRSNKVNVYDQNSHALLASIALFGGNPRALAASPDGTRVYGAFALSGNGSTIIPASLAPPQPAPTNRALPAAPQTSLIVSASDPHWSSVVRYTMPDNDVFAIDTSSLAVTNYFSQVGTINLGIAVNPTSGDLFVSNTDALNLVRFEPNLRGHFVNNRVTKISMSSGTITPLDLNAGISYAVLPNATALASALAQPSAIVFDPAGAFYYTAAFGTDRIAKLSVNPAQVSARIELSSASVVDPAHKRGPRGLALNSPANTLYVLNRISNTIQVINTATNAVTKEIPVGSFDPTPTVIRSGRGFLYDARLSGNGTGSCASCHVDGDMDHLAWDLGDPGGSMTSVVNNGNTFQFHPMKGPMTTLTLKGLNGIQPLHWRGDRVNFAAFNPAFSTLLGGTQLSSGDLAAYQAFINTIQFQPNPNQNLDRTLPTSLAGGNPQTGQKIFTTQPFVSNVTCAACHTFPGTGTNDAIIPGAVLQQPETQNMKTPELRNMYQKQLFNNATGAPSIDGFGFVHDGFISTLIQFLAQPVFASFSNNAQIQVNLSAFMQCFDTGMAPAAGYTRTVTTANVSNTAVLSDWTLLETQATAKNVDLIVKGTINGQLHGLVYRPGTNDYKTDKTGLGPFTRAQLLNLIKSGDTLTPMGVPPGSGLRMGIDRNLDGVLDGDSF
jgi:YVTN family beta-propeller protein